MRSPPNDISPPALAQLAVEMFIRDREIANTPEDPEGVLHERAGVFVTIRSIDGMLRGCIGTISPFHDTVAQEIIQNAISAATRDPRFHPVSQNELPLLHYGVDILSTPEKVSGPPDLDASVYGVIIETFDGRRRGLLLPGIEGLNTVEEQWLAVHSKAGIEPGTPVRVERCTVTRFGKE
jgi:MEMO1 family protein